MQMTVIKTSVVLSARASKTTQMRFPRCWASSPPIVPMLPAVGLVRGKHGGGATAVVDNKHLLMKKVTSETACGDDLLLKQKSSKSVNLAVQATIEGEEAQIVTIDLEPGQIIRTRPNTMLYRQDGIQMVTHMPKDGAVGRFLSNTPLFLVDYINTGQKATLALGARSPGKILRINMDDLDGELTIRKGAFLVGCPELEMSVKRSSKSVLAQLFGGQGLLLQTLRGKGSVLLRSGGVQIKKELEKDELLRIHPASLVAFSNGVRYDVTKSTSFNNVMFGDESIFVTTVSGPGTVWLQGMHPKFFTRTETHTVESSSESSDNNKSDSSSSGTVSTKT